MDFGISCVSIDPKKGASRTRLVTANAMKDTPVEAATQMAGAALKQAVQPMAGAAKAARSAAKAAAGKVTGAPRKAAAGARRGR